MPAGLVDEQNGVVSRSDFRRDLGEVQVHRPGIASWQDERSTLALLRADRAKDIG
jgi:hypothetical protein